MGYTTESSILSSSAPMKTESIKNLTDHQLYRSIGALEARKPLTEAEGETLANLKKEADWRDNNIYTES